MWSEVSGNGYVPIALEPQIRERKGFVKLTGSPFMEPGQIRTDDLLITNQFLAVLHDVAQCRCLSFNFIICVIYSQQHHCIESH
jgi:hypothetical protein